MIFHDATLYIDVDAGMMGSQKGMGREGGVGFLFIILSRLFSA